MSTQNMKTNKITEENHGGEKIAQGEKLEAASSEELMDLVNSLYAELEHRNRQLEAIQRVSNALFPLSSVDTLVRKALGVAIEVVNADAGSVQLHDPQTDTLVFRYVMGEGASTLVGTAVTLSKGINSRVFLSGLSHLTNNVDEIKDIANEDVDQLTGYHTKSMLTVPIKRSDGDPIGVMQVLNGRQPFNQRDLEVLEVLCAQVALAIENAFLKEQVQQS